MKVCVIGHKNPDTDAICSAIGYAGYLRKTRYPEAEAVCCGDINARTQFVLDRANMEPPRLVMDVRPDLDSIARHEFVKAYQDESIHVVYRRMVQHHVRSLPVLQRQSRQLCGMLSFSRLMEKLLPEGPDPEESRLVETSLERVQAVLKGQALHVEAPAQDQNFCVMVAAMSADGFTTRMRKYDPRDLMIVAGDRPTVQLPAIEYGVRCLVITGGYTLSPGLMKMAMENHVSILVSPLDTATTTLMIRSARVIRDAINTSFVKFQGSALVSRIRKQLHSVSQDLFPVVDSQDQVTGVFSKSDLIDPEPVNLVLVDHNESTQAVTGVEEARVLEVIDHHRLGGGLATSEPIRFINVPVGSTSTIVGTFYQNDKLQPEPKEALCLVAGIISDTLNLTSPTTTQTDRDILAWLSGIAGIEIDAFAEEFFSAGSILDTSPPEEAITIDCKEYREGPWSFTVAQIEELGLRRFEEVKGELAEALATFCRERRLDFSCLMVTDITKHFSLLMLAGDPRVADAVHFPDREDQLFAMEGFVSRKKQLMPYLTRLLSRLDK